MMKNKGEIMEVSKGFSPQDAIAQLQICMKDMEKGFQEWVSKQSLPMEAATLTLMGTVQGVGIGCVVSTVIPIVASVFKPRSAAVTSLKPPPPMNRIPIIADIAIMTGLNEGFACVLKRMTGKNDIHNSMVAGFGAGALSSIIKNMGCSPNLQAAYMVQTGVIFAIFQGALFTSAQHKTAKSTHSKEETLYTKTKSMLTTLGYQNYERNFRKGLLSDITLPLLTDMALRDVNIPPGARLVILDHIQKEPELRKRL
ncbi:hypothetical protein GIB67_011465 [Kingdonia uniflora]|uniref:SAM domain-containing protein n=1 Tax=Kingdonia uniflora TaxID=39325 RepID=A0A7J7NM34_9MAGN|nr:hypothetical protein GIB67_011465 [Kingdonia uniflora]